MTTDELLAKLRRPQGLCCSIGRTDYDNREVIRVILDAYIAYLDGGPELETAHRASAVWLPVSGLPIDFANYCYRIAE